jgi:hypothetical protein
MNKEVFRDYFYKGFEDGLEKIAAEQAKQVALQKSASFGRKVEDKIAEGVGNAIVRGGFHIGGMAASGAMRGLMGNKLRGQHKRFIEKLMSRDAILKNRPKATVISHYTTMVRVSPSIALDPNVVASFLRESTAYETMSTVTVKTLVDLEKSMTDTAASSSKKYTHFVGGK